MLGYHVLNQMAIIAGLRPLVSSLFPSFPIISIACPGGSVYTGLALSFFLLVRLPIEILYWEYRELLFIYNVIIGL